MIFFMVNCVSKINVARCLLSLESAIALAWLHIGPHCKCAQQSAASVWHRFDLVLKWYWPFHVLIALPTAFFFSITTMMIFTESRVQLIFFPLSLSSSHMTGIIDCAVCTLLAMFAFAFVFCIWMIRNWFRYGMAYGSIQMKHGSTFHDTRTQTHTDTHNTLGLSAVCHYTANM